MIIMLQRIDRRSAVSMFCLGYNFDRDGAEVDKTTNMVSSGVSRVVFWFP